MAFFWRFVDYGDRWILNQDQARDVSIAIYGLKNDLIPEIGSPSSAGPFNFGPWYFWLLMVLEKVGPTVNGPWVGFTLLSVVTVILYAKMGKIMAGEIGMLVAGLVAGAAAGQVENSADMLNTVMVGSTSALAWWLTAKMVNSGKWQWGLGVGWAVGLSINCHFQAWGLMGLLLSIVLINRERMIKRLGWGVALAAGWAGAFLPILWFDLRHNWVWTKSVVEYYTVGVKKFYVPVRWLTEIRDFWPQLLGKITVGSGHWGYVILVLGLVSAGIVVARKRKVDRFWLVATGSWVIQVFLMRNYRGVRSQEYLIVFHGYAILLLTWILLTVYDWKKRWGQLLLVVFLMASGWSNWRMIKERQSQARLILDLKSDLDKTIGRNNVDVYNFRESNMVAMPLFYLWYRENRINEKGVKIGFCDANRYGDCPNGEIKRVKNYKVYQLENEDGFDQLTPEKVYGTLMINYGK